MFIDRHDANGLTPEEVSEAHKLDIDLQDQFGVKYHTYWFDPGNGTVFCLAEGPSQEAVEAVHQRAHGQTAPVIIEIDVEAPLNALFGGLPTYPVGMPYTEPATRAIVFTDICGSVAQTQELGDEEHLSLLREHDALVRAALAAHGGREIKHTGDGIMAAFTSVSSSVLFAIDAQRAFDHRNERAATPLQISIGVSAGEPVTDNDQDLFGAAVQLAARLCDSAPEGEIHVSVAVRELCLGKSIHFEDRGTVELKGFSEPPHVYSVAWR